MLLSCSDNPQVHLRVNVPHLLQLPSVPSLSPLPKSHTQNGSASYQVLLILSSLPHPPCILPHTLIQYGTDRHQSKVCYASFYCVKLLLHRCWPTRDYIANLAPLSRWSWGLSKEGLLLHLSPPRSPVKHRGFYGW